MRINVEFGSLPLSDSLAFRRARWFQTYIVIGVSFLCATATADQRPLQSRTMELRSGAVTLDPLPNVPSSDNVQSAPSDSNSNFSHAEPTRSGRSLIEFERRLTEMERRVLADKGVTIDSFVGGTVYSGHLGSKSVEELTKLSGPSNKIIRATPIDERNAHIKIDPNLGVWSPQQQEERRGSAENPTANDQVNIIVELWAGSDVVSEGRTLSQYGKVVAFSSQTRKVEMVVNDRKVIAQISNFSSVKFIAPSYVPKAQNTHVVKNMGVEAGIAPPYYLTGRGVRVGIWDEGYVADHHPSFSGRLTFDLSSEGTSSKRESKHSTHVAGTIAGTGEYEIAVPTADGRNPLETDMESFGDEVKRSEHGEDGPVAAGESTEQLEPRYPGVAPAAQLISYNFVRASNELIGVLRDKPDSLDVVNNSWVVELRPDSCHLRGAYGALGTSDYDALISGRLADGPIRRVPVVFAAGNVRNDGICGMTSAPGFSNYRTVLPPSTAKNVITVGAIDADNNGMTEFSDWGPTADGRLKPEVVAPGCRNHGVQSATPATGVGYSCGTSMAAPAVTGVISLLIERMSNLGIDRKATLPSSYKALLIHGAEDLGQSGPDYRFGFGRVRVAPMLKIIDDNALSELMLDHEGDTLERTIVVPPEKHELKVTLVWDDPPADALAKEPLVNDLDLEVISPAGAKTLPFILNPAPGKEHEPAQTGADHTNVVEQIVLIKPAPGGWRILIRMAKLGMARGGQSFSLIATSQ